MRPDLSQLPSQPPEAPMREASTRARAREALIWIERRFGLSRADLPFLWSAAREPGTNAGRDGKGESK